MIVSCPPLLPSYTLCVSAERGKNTTLNGNDPMAREQIGSGSEGEALYLSLCPMTFIPDSCSAPWIGRSLMPHLA